MATLREMRRAISEWESLGIGANEIHYPLAAFPEFTEFTIEAGPGTETGWDLYYPGYNSPAGQVWDEYTTLGLDNGSRAETKRICAWVLRCAADWLRRAKS